MIISNRYPHEFPQPIPGTQGYAEVLRDVLHDRRVQFNPPGWCCRHGMPAPTIDPTGVFRT